MGNDVSDEQHVQLAGCGDSIKGGGMIVILRKRIRVPGDLLNFETVAHVVRRF
jgi:hypothetical protein